MDETDKKIEVNSTEEKMYTKEEAIAAIEQAQIPAESFSYTYEDTFMMEDLENRKLYINYQIDKNINEFKRVDKTRFEQDNFIEQIDFDYLEIEVIEE